MKIYNISTEFIKTYSLGIEKNHNYDERSIEYESNTIVFFYNYYRDYKIAYIVKDDENGIELPQIEGKVEIITELEDFSLDKLRILMKRIKGENKNILFKQKDTFYRNLKIMLDQPGLVFSKIIGMIYKETGVVYEFNYIKRKLIKNRKCSNKRKK